MKRLLCPQLPKPHRPAPLSESEANHAMRVLRLRDGDSVVAMDGQGNSIPAILRTHAGAPRLEIPATSDARLVQAQGQAPGTVVPFILEMAILKGDAMEWVVEKAVELGVRTLIPALTAHTVVQLKNKGPEAFQERWQKIADQALKQCGRLERLEVQLPTELEDLLARKPATQEVPRLWCDETVVSDVEQTPDLTETLRRFWDAETPPPSEIRLLIGPEGGWSENERTLLSHASHRVGLGPLVLRAETAAIYGVSLVTASLRGSLRLSPRASNRLTKSDG